MLEQFRMLEAALRLGEFTAAQLAQESGVALGTVLKTLRRRADLFKSTKGARTGRRGGQPKTHRVRTEVVRAAMQSQVDHLKLPLPAATGTGEPLGLLLAKDTLLRVFPQADNSDRRRLLSAVESHFALASRSAESAVLANLQGIHKQLLTLVTSQEWMLGLPSSIQKLKSYNAVLTAIEMMLSLAERRERDKDKARTKRAFETILLLPMDVSAVADFVSRNFAHLAQPQWRLDVLSASWSLLSNPAWQDVAGDLIAPELLVDNLPRIRVAIDQAELIDDIPKMPDTGRRIAVTSLKRPPTKAPSAQGDYVLKNEFGYWARPVQVTGFRGFVTRVAMGFPAGASFRIMIDRADLMIFEETGGLLSFEPRRYLARIVGFDLDLTSKILTHAVVTAHEPRRPSLMSFSISIPYSQLRFWHALSPLSAGPSSAWYAPAELISDIDIGERAPPADFKAGVFQWTSFNEAQIVLAAKDRVDVYSASPPDMIFGFEQDFHTHSTPKIGEVIGIGVNLERGILVDAAILELQAGGLNKVPFENLEYQANRRCFLLHSVPRPWIGPPAGTAAVRQFTGSVGKWPSQ
jgi:hypothetical protein